MRSKYNLSALKKQKQKQNVVTRMEPRLWEEPHREWKAGQEKHGLLSPRLLAQRDRKFPLWSREDRDEIDGGRGTRVSPHLPPGPLGGTLWTPESKELANPVGGRGTRQWTRSLLDTPGGEGWVREASLLPLPVTSLPSLLRGFRAAGWRDVRGEGDVGTAWGSCTFGL